MSTPIEELKGGEYELIAEIFDQPTNEDGKPFTFKRFRRGDTVTLDQAEAQRLYKAGAVVLPGEREKAAAALAFAQYQAALAALPDAIREQVLAAQAGEPIKEPAPESSNEDEPEKPKRTAPKGEWVAFAVANGAEEEEAEASSKDDLIATYGG